MSEEHRPSAEFVDHLEWQLRTSLARGNRFSEPVRSNRGGKMKIAALVLISALFGAGGVVANDEFQEAKAQEILLARVQGDMELASLELDIMLRRIEESEERFSVGVIGEEELVAARAGVKEAEARLAALQLDLEEIQLSGRAPNSDLTAPLVKGRDFVAERSALDESVASIWYNLAQMRVSRTQQLRDLGVVPDEELSATILSLQEAEFELERVRERLRVRQSVVDGSLELDEAQREFEILETEKRIQLIRVGLGNAAVRFRRVADLVEVGAAPDSELAAAQLQVMELETELEFLEMKLMALRGGEI